MSKKISKNKPDSHMLSIGQNTKLHKAIAVFNLPAVVTCPGHTAFCSKVCYAKKAERIYKAAKLKRIRNLKSAIDPDFVSNMIKEIKYNHILKLRIHESGDFYSQRYLNKWKKIVAACPETKFLVYTKSFKLDFSGLSDNCMLYYSIDMTTPKGWAKLPGPFAWTIHKGSEAPTNYFVCSPINSKSGHINYCGDSCNHCWDGGGNAAWIQH